VTVRSAAGSWLVTSADESSRSDANEADESVVSDICITFLSAAS
jgi:hypothetical protein